MFEFTIPKFGDRKFTANSHATIHNLTYSYLWNKGIFGNQSWYYMGKKYQTYVCEEIKNSKDICIGDIVYITTALHNETNTYALIILDNNGNKIYRLIKDIIPKMNIGAILYPLLEHNKNFFMATEPLQNIDNKFNNIMSREFVAIANKYNKYIESRIMRELACSIKDNVTL